MREINQTIFISDNYRKKEIDWLFRIRCAEGEKFLSNSDDIGMNEQWIQLIQYSSYRSHFPASIPRKTGVGKLCRSTDINFGENDQTENGWIFSNDNREECLIVSFRTSVFINEICVYENLNPGSIMQLQMLESRRNQWWTMWQRKSATYKNSASHNIFRPILRRYHLQSNTIRIIFDLRYADRVGIQAIKLVGSPGFDNSIHQVTLPQAVLKLYEQIFDQNKTDVHFLIDNQIFNAHGNILCSRSLYFRALLLGDFHEKNEQKPIELTDIDAETFLELLFFIYTGTYHPTISYDLAVKCLIYSNKINFLSGKDAALEKICHYIRSDHSLILAMYCLIKQMSPALDSLLDYIYELFSRYMDEISREEVFYELDKDLIIDLIRQSSQRRKQQTK